MSRTENASQESAIEGNAVSLRIVNVVVPKNVPIQGKNALITSVQRVATKGMSVQANHNAEVTISAHMRQTNALSDHLQNAK